MHQLYRWVIVLGGGIASVNASAQNVINSATYFTASSDNTGSSSNQSGTEVMASPFGAGVTLEAGGSFEHVGQFYMAQDGIWNAARVSDAALAGTDYFGYAPAGAGSYLPYQGVGIQGASSANQGVGAGRPVFGHVQLNSTGKFPVPGGMYVAHSLTFNANGPGKSSIITTPNTLQAETPDQAVVFAPTAILTGADNQNFIDGFASVTGVTKPFTLPLGDAEAFPAAFHPLTIDNPTTGTVTARYQRGVGHTIVALGAGVGSVSTAGTWLIAAPVGTQLSVNASLLGVTREETANLRLVGWNGSRWVNLSGSAPAGGCLPGNCSLSGTLVANITDLAIGSTSRALATNDGETALLTVWPNPAQGQLNVGLSNGRLETVQVFDVQGRRLVDLPALFQVDTSTLPGGTYILEVKTTRGQLLHKTFVKQP